MTVLLEEDRLERVSLCKPSLQRDALPFSDGSLQLGSGVPFLHGELHTSPLLSNMRHSQTG